MLFELQCKLFTLHVVEGQVNIIGVLIHEFVSHPATCHSHHRLELPRLEEIAHHREDFLLERSDHNLGILLHAVLGQSTKQHIINADLLCL